MKPPNLNSRLSRGFPPDARYLIGVSGGRDSVALLHWLIDLGYKKLIVCHLNHQLRGRSSDADARFVQKLVGRYNEKLVGQALRLPGAGRGKRSARPAMQMPRIDFEGARRTFARWRRKKRCRSRPQRVTRATRFSPKPRSAMGAARFSWRITPMIWLRRSCLT